MADETKDVISSGAGLAAVLPAEGSPSSTPPTPSSPAATGSRSGAASSATRSRSPAGSSSSSSFLVAFIGAPIAAHILGHGPNDLFAGGARPEDAAAGRPAGRTSRRRPYVGRAGHFRTTLLRPRRRRPARPRRVPAPALRRADLARGRDRRDAAEHDRRRDHGRDRPATSAAGIDTIVSRLTEIVMAFPILLFIIALASTAGDRLEQDHARRRLRRRGW